MRAFALAMAAALLLGAQGVSAQGWPGQQPISPEVKMAIAGVGQDAGAELTHLAEAGRLDAEFYLGTMMIFGAGGVPKDGVKGCGWLAKASASRADAMHVVGECYQYGYGGEKDLEKAIATFHKAGDMGFPKARCAEGNVLFELHRDEPRAFALCREGAEAGDPDAQTDVGNYYLEGKHVTKDVAAARGWYEKAVAANRQRNAAFVLGQIYWNGDGVAKDNAKAAEYWRIAYASGRLDAAKFLGDEAFVRAGAGKNVWRVEGLDEAAGWYDKAAAAETPQIRMEAVERATLMRQMKGVMQRRGQGS
jgi:TPR repeat protein